jgi:hypothetical protein
MGFSRVCAAKIPNLSPYTPIIKSNSHFSNPCPDDVADQGREPLGICPVCRFTVCRDNAVQTGGGAWLHPACLRR